MKKIKSGFTLIEVIITMMIVVMVFGLVASLVGFSTTFFKNESTQVANQESLRLVATYFEKDSRMYVSRNIDISFNSTTKCATMGSSTVITYCLNANNILRNGVVIASGVQTFNVVIDAANSAIHLRLVSIPDTRNNPIEVNYMIRIRIGETGTS